MADAYTKVQVEDVEMRERKGGGPGSRDLSGAIGAETMTLRFWKFGPGDQMAYHRHQEQEEIYGLLVGGPRRCSSRARS